MLVLLDTNILLRFANPVDPEYNLVRAAVAALGGRGTPACFVPQNLVEFWNVCTRPSRNNGLGLSIAETERRAKVIEREALLLPDNRQVHAEWRRLVVAFGISGSQVHDARLVAAMLAHGVPQLLTLNDRDFKRFSEITVLHPRDFAPAV